MFKWSWINNIFGEYAIDQTSVLLWTFEVKLQCTNWVFKSSISQERRKIFAEADDSWGHKKSENLRGQLQHAEQEWKETHQADKEKAERQQSGQD